MTTLVLTPLDVSQATELSGQSGRWRKQILPIRKINYKGRTLDFNATYLASLRDSFKRRAFDQVPAQLADSANKHNNDPKNTVGDLVDVELGSDGLYGVFEPNADGAAILAKNPKIGVSARILEGYRRSDGEVFPQALQHVLLTVDPHVSGMKPWEKVELSNDLGVESTLDLSGYEEETDMTKPATGTGQGDENKDGDVVTLSREEYTAFQELLTERKAVLEFTAGLTPEDVEDGDEDEEDGEEGDGEGTGDGTTAPPEVPDAVKLAFEAQSAQILELTNQLHATEVNNEVEKLLGEGLAPAIVEAARPLLGLADASIELSNGDKLDVPKQVHGLLRALIDLSNRGESIINYGGEIGLSATADPQEQQRSAQLKAWNEFSPIGQ
jgi:hypothetical protein